MDVVPFEQPRKRRERAAPSAPVPMSPASVSAPSGFHGPEPVTEAEASDRPEITLAVEYVLVEELVPDAGNPRHMSEAELEKLTRSVKKFGLVDPVIARRVGHVVINGHHRLLAARKLGITRVPVIFVDISPEEARVLGVTLNNINGRFDEDLLAQLLRNLAGTPGLDLTVTGYGEDELRALLKTMETRELRDRPETLGLDEALRTAYDHPRVQPGDLFALGDQLLFCGNAIGPDVDTLMGGKRAAMALTDPPYRANLGRHGGQQRGQVRRPMANDDLPPEEWEQFVRGFIRNLLAFTDGAIYCFMGSRELTLLSRVFEEEGGHWSDYIVWDKGPFVLGRAPYQRAFEVAWFGWRRGAKPYWCGSRRESDVWHIDRPLEAPLHPSMKPLGLLEKAITNSSRPGDIVLDPFLGSGSTLIACERTGRICHGVEIDPHFASLSLVRWEAFTGREARKLNS